MELCTLYTRLYTLNTPTKRLMLRWRNQYLVPLPHQDPKRQLQFDRRHLALFIYFQSDERSASRLPFHRRAAETLTAFPCQTRGQRPLAPWRSHAALTRSAALPPPLRGGKAAPQSRGPPTPRDARRSRGGLCRGAKAAARHLVPGGRRPGRVSPPPAPALRRPFLSWRRPGPGSATRRRRGKRPSPGAERPVPSGDAA